MQELEILNEFLVLLVVSIINVVLSKRLNLSPVLGYLCLGAMLGAYSIVGDNSYIQHISEFGVVFLLFVIGLELSFDRLMQMRRHVFGFGGLQIIITTAILAYLLMAVKGLAIEAAIVIGCALSLSSTAVVMQVLSESKRQSSQVGRLSLSVLLMQDFAVVPLLAITPMIAEPSDKLLKLIGMSGIKALVAIILITIAGRLLLRPFFRLVGSAKSEEIYVSTTLLLVLGASYMTAKFGLSTAMGAFIAGILIAETEYRSRVEQSIMPFKSLLLGMFFLLVGISIDTHYIYSRIADVLIASFSLIVIKAAVLFLLCKIFRFRNGAAIHSALLLSQGSEFAFILFSMAASQGVINQSLAQFLLVVVSITMAVTPLLALAGRLIEDRLDEQDELDKSSEFKGVSDLDQHIIISGFGRVGRVIAYMLYEMNYNYIAVDSDLMLVKKARAQGFPVYHGNLANIEILKAVGADRASCMILTMNDKNALKSAVRVVSSHFRDLPIISRAEDFKHGKGLLKLGADICVPATIETGLQMGGALLKQLGVAELEVLDIKEQFRRNEYAFTEEIELFRGLAPSKQTTSD